MSKLFVPERTFILPFAVNNDRAYTIELMDAANIRNSFERNLLLNPPYPLSLPLRELLKPMRKDATSSPPRPMNGWIIFRRDLEGQLRFYYSGQPRSMKETSAIASNFWKNRPKVKLYFTILAKLAEKVHKDVYPDYCYKPKRSNRPKPPSWPFIQVDGNKPTRKKNNKKDVSEIDGQTHQHIGQCNVDNNTHLQNNVDESCQRVNIYVSDNTLSLPSNVHVDSFGLLTIRDNATIQDDIGTSNFPTIGHEIYFNDNMPFLIYIPVLENGMEEYPMISNVP
ncbi:3128_t:CDS:1 [Paraglomus brasilianum]|uniref:3128_t:CDS:1 n=1 Tax=Paraglomus brasilianum TaxID=144538 RepID=A0A9N8VS05_9GLOM|nr:3128_t:CDS:1 [Paraglomus brasilianum]